MKEKNGFTLVEIVISLVILVLLTVLIGSKIVNSSSESKQKLYDSKIKVAISAAEKYGQDNLDDLNSSECYDVSIKTLITLRYLASDTSSEYEFLSPIDNTSLTNKIICIKYIDGKVKATLK